jgi:two-component system, OmpR family, phosphate regulon sensor histidine kinase PhoR
MKRRVSFQSWILGGCLVVVVCSLVFVGLLMERSLGEQMVATIRNSLGPELGALREVVSDRWRPGQSLARTDALADELGRIVQARVSIIAADGKVLGDSQVPLAELPTLENHASRPEVSQAMSQGVGSSIRYSSTLDLDLMYAATRLDRVGGNKLIVRLALPLSQVQQAVSQTRRLVLWALFLGVLLSVGVAYLVARSLSKPVQRLTKTARAIAAGDLSTRFRRYPRHEIGDLGRAFDQMADNLEGKLEDITRSRDRLEAILRGMMEGVLVTDREGHILLVNRALKNLLDLESAPVGRLPSEIIRNPELLEALEEVRAGRKYVSREISVLSDHPRQLEAHVVRLSGQKGQTGVVCVLHDITERKRIEKMRRDFVANVSHELRTPLTAMRGAAETLLEGALDNPQYAGHFVELILRQNRRLESLVQDLLELARLESGEAAPKRQAIEAAELADHIMDAMGDLAESSGVELELRLPKRSFSFRADARQLEQAVLNLMDNAIKYTGQGGQVSLAMERSGDEMLITVSDSGPGIAAKHLPRLFERFYRADTNRSRELGGTGLGLAIVKHIAQAHGGKVSVESTPGRGSIFRLNLPA